MLHVNSGLDMREPAEESAPAEERREKQRFVARLIALNTGPGVDRRHLQNAGRNIDHYDGFAAPVISCPV